MATLRVNVYVEGFGWAGPAYGDLPDEYLGGVDERHVVEGTVAAVEAAPAGEVAEPLPDPAPDPAPLPEPPPPPAPTPVEKPAPKPRRRRTS